MFESDMMSRLLPLALGFIAVVFVFIIGVMIYIKRQNDKQPILTVQATIVLKEVEADQTSFGTSTFSRNSNRVNFKHHYYHITFQTEAESNRRFFVSQEEYGRLCEGDLGILTFQGGRYLGFKKNDSITSG